MTPQIKDITPSTKHRELKIAQEANVIARTKTMATNQVLISSQNKLAQTIKTRKLRT
jgi:hypothetical protein